MIWAVLTGTALFGSLTANNLADNRLAVALDRAGQTIDSVVDICHRAETTTLANR